MRIFKISKVFVISCCIIILIIGAFPPKTADAAEAVKLNVTSFTIRVGQTYTVKVIGTNKKAAWSSENEKIAAVDKNGKVKGVKTDSVIINANVGNKTYSVKVSVVKAISKDDFNIGFVTLWTGNGYGQRLMKNFIDTVGLDMLYIGNTDEGKVPTGWNSGSGITDFGYRAKPYYEDGNFSCFSGRLLYDVVTGEPAYDNCYLTNRGIITLKSTLTDVRKAYGTGTLVTVIKGEPISDLLEETNLVKFIDYKYYYEDEIKGGSYRIRFYFDKNNIVSSLVLIRDFMEEEGEYSEV